MEREYRPLATAWSMNCTPQPSNRFALFGPTFFPACGPLAIASRSGSSSRAASQRRHHPLDRFLNPKRVARLRRSRSLRSYPRADSRRERRRRFRRFRSSPVRWRRASCIPNEINRSRSVIRTSSLARSATDTRRSRSMAFRFPSRQTVRSSAFFPCRRRLRHGMN